MPIQNHLTEMRNDSATVRDENGITRERVIDFIAKHGAPTELVGRFGERGRKPDGYTLTDIFGPLVIDGERHPAFLERDSSWFCLPSPEGETE